MQLTPETIMQIRENAKKELAKRNYSDYVEYVHKGAYQHFNHTLLVCEKLQEIIDGKQKYIIIEMPPRHGKSMTVTETFPSFYLAKNPNKRVITTSYSDTLATKFGRLNRHKLLDVGDELFGLSVSKEVRSNSNWGIERYNGGMLSTSIGGALTGQGADLMIIDDPIKNNKEAQSQTIRQNIWDEWESTLSTRLHKGASVIVIMTRWHEDDIVGRLLETSPYDWERIRLPAIAEDESDLLNREVGEPLCSELGYDLEWAELKKQEVGSRTWASLYQQRPSPAGGNIFNRSWWQYYDTLPSKLTDFSISVDATFKGNDDSDFVVMQCWARDGANKYLIDQIRQKLSFTETVKTLRQFKNKHKKVRQILIEDKANGSAIIDVLKKEISGIIPVNPDGGKEVRGQAVAPEIEAGNIYLPLHADFTGDFVEECTAFPFGKNDDQVDAMTQQLNRYSKRKQATVITKNLGI